MLYFKDINTIHTGGFVNYNNDRLVFYYDAYRGTDFTAYVGRFVIIPNRPNQI
ncbi:hypothetical protein BDZ94DRAFT_1262983, partial [Collybia nuda]